MSHGRPALHDLAPHSPLWIRTGIMLAALCASAVCAPKPSDEHTPVTNRPPITSPKGTLSIPHRIEYGLNDFMHFYAAGKLCGTRDLYTPQRALQEEMKATGYYGPTLLVVRLPYFALLLSPFAHLPYRIAYIAFQALSILAVFAFIGMQSNWDERMRALVVCFTSFPLILSICLGQDITFVMLLIAVLMRYWDAKPGLAGVALAFCTVKYNLFLFMPLVLLLHWRRRLAISLLITGSALAVVSFAVAGPTWPQQYIEQLRSSSDVPTVMPNIRALLLGTQHPVLYSILASAVVSVFAILALVRCRHNLPLCTAIALTAGILVTLRVHVQDCAILVPLLLLLWNNRSRKVIVGLVWALLMPVPYVFRLMNGDLAGSIQFLLLLFIASAAILGSSAITVEAPEGSTGQLAATGREEVRFRPV